VGEGEIAGEVSGHQMGGCGRDVCGIGPTTNAGWFAPSGSAGLHSACVGCSPGGEGWGDIFADRGRGVSKGVGEEQEDLSLIPWLREAVGMVQFLTFTRMEIILALNLVAKNMHRLCQRVKVAMMQILRYLANRLDDGLLYTSGGMWQWNVGAMPRGNPSQTVEVARGLR